MDTTWLMWKLAKAPRQPTVGSACTARWAISAPGMQCSVRSSKKHRVIALSLRRFFPEHWDGIGNDYLMAQHVADVIGFIEKLNAGPVDLIGHSRGGHIGFRVAQARPDLLRKADSCRTGR